ncbi:Histidyl-tRNA synthetase, partial [mine drainage metagenome]
MPDCQPIIEKAPSIIDFLCEISRSHYEEVCSGLRNLSIPFTVNHRLVRGLDYYTETTFEFVSNALGSQSTWAAGGQYDGLIGQLEGPDVSGAGFAIGVERLALLAEKSGTLPIPPTYSQDISVIPLGEEAMPLVQRLIRDAREAGVSATGIFGATKIKQGFKQAERDGSRFLLIVGEDEIAKKELLLKDLLTSEQISVPLFPLTKLIEHIRAVRSQE